MRKLKTHELNRLSVEDFKKSAKIPVVVILDNIRSMYNVGSVFRSADAFLVEKMYLCGITPKPPHREIHKTAIGATESVAWEYVENIDSLVRFLKENNYKIIGLEQTDESIFIQDFRVENHQKYAVILGNEVDGISDSVIDQTDACLEIPQFGTKHSLNVSVAAGIVLYHFASILK